MWRAECWMSTIIKGLRGLGSTLCPCCGSLQIQFWSTLIRESYKDWNSYCNTYCFLEVVGYFGFFFLSQLWDIKKINISKVCIGMHSYVHNSWELLRHSRGSNSAEVMGQIPNHSDFILLHLDPICSVLKHPRHGNRREPKVTVPCSLVFITLWLTFERD